MFLAIFFRQSFADGDIYAVLGPEEIPAGEQFTVIVSGKPVSKDQNRMIAIQFPDNWKIVKAYAAEDGATESTSIEQYPDIVSYFEKEKGRTVKVFEDRTRVYSENFDGIAYFFVFTSPAATSTGNFKACFIERSDPGMPATKEITKSKKPKPAKIRNYDWRIVSPGLGNSFAFSQVTSEKNTHSVRFVSGWLNTSRALVMNDSLGAVAKLSLRPEVLQNFFNRPFTIQWWIRAVSGEQAIFRFMRQDSSSGLAVLANPFGQIDIRRIPTGGDTDIAILSTVTTCDGAWHHIAFSCDGIGILRIFIDGELDDSVANAGEFFRGLSYFSIGSEKAPQHVAIDELRLIKRAIVSDGEIAADIAVAARDTLSDVLALFHFEEFGMTARSSVALINPPKDSSSRPISEAIYFGLGGGAYITETSSPVLLDRASLAVEQSSATKVNFTWKATSELGTRRYELQRRIATFGEYEKMLSVPAKRPPASESLVVRASYSAAEKLPQLSHDIDLYYRLALIGDHDSVIEYTEPVKLEFGGAREVFVEQNKPNPFNPRTTIGFRVVKNSYVKVAVYDIIGREVEVLQDGKMTAGKHSIDIDATNWPAGIYFYKVKTAKTIVTKKMVLAK